MDRVSKKGASEKPLCLRGNIQFEDADKQRKAWEGLGENYKVKETKQLG